MARSPSYVQLLILRGFLVDGKPDAASKNFERFEGLSLRPGEEPAGHAVLHQRLDEGTAAMPAGRSFSRWLTAPYARPAKARRVFPSLLDIQLPFPLEGCVLRVPGPASRARGGHARPGRRRPHTRTRSSNWRRRAPRAPTPWPWTSKGSRSGRRA